MINNGVTLTVLRGAPLPARSIRSLITGGGLALGGGVAFGVGFLGEVVKAWATGQHAGLTWFVVIALVSGALTVLGWAQGTVLAGHRPVAIVATATDTREPAKGRALADQALAAAKASTVVVHADVAVLESADLAAVDALALSVAQAVEMTKGLAPDARRIALLPMLRLGPAFRLGALLGTDHRIDVWQAKDRVWSPALPLVPSTPAAAAARVRVEVEDLEGGGPGVALALDLQARVSDFRGPVLADCVARGIGHVVHIATSTDVTEDLAGLADAIVAAWRQHAPAATGQRYVYLSGPASVAVALGARLGAQQADRWTPLTFADGCYVPL